MYLEPSTVQRWKWQKQKIVINIWYQIKDWIWGYELNLDEIQKWFLSFVQIQFNTEVWPPEKFQIHFLKLQSYSGHPKLDLVFSYLVRGKMNFWLKREDFNILDYIMPIWTSVEAIDGHALHASETRVHRIWFELYLRIRILSYI